MRSNLLFLYSSLGLVAPSFCSPIKAQANDNVGCLSDWEQIYQIINLYPLAVDFNSTHELFPLIYAENAFANYSSPDGKRQNLRGLQTIIDTFAPDGEHYDAHHLLGSIRINLTKDQPDKANGTFYALTNTFGKGRFAGQQATFYGIYHDEYERIDEQGWRVTTRLFSQVGPASGNVSLLEGP